MTSTPTPPAIQPVPVPDPSHPLPGKHVTLVPISTTHTADLYACMGGPSADNTALWTYLPEGPFPTPESFSTYIHDSVNTPSMPLALYSVVLNTTQKAAGFGALLRADPIHRVIEVGVVFSPSLQKTRAATEVIYLLGCYVFDVLGYRRLEWKTNTLNTGSRRAAERLGFTYEGTFRQHMVVKGRNRDTAWYSVLDREWGDCKKGFEGWLSEENFDVNGKQRRGLRECREEISGGRGGKRVKAE